MIKYFIGRKIFIIGNFKDQIPPSFIRLSGFPCGNFILKNPVNIITPGYQQLVFLNSFQNFVETVSESLNRIRNKFGYISFIRCVLNLPIIFTSGYIIKIGENM